MIVDRDIRDHGGRTQRRVEQSTDRTVNTTEPNSRRGVPVPPAPPFTFGVQTCTGLSAGATREWLVADGLGGYASGTVSGLRTRRYHALQVVAGDTPASRRVGLVALDPVLRLPSG